jgi:hypothetical protein
MTIAGHKRCKGIYLRYAAASAKRRDYLAAADWYRAAAHHDAVIAALKLHKVK